MTLVWQQQNPFQSEGVRWRAQRGRFLLHVHGGGFWQTYVLFGSKPNERTRSLVDSGQVTHEPGLTEQVVEQCAMIAAEKALDELGREALYPPTVDLLTREERKSFECYAWLIDDAHRNESPGLRRILLALARLAPKSCALPRAGAVPRFCVGHHSESVPATKGVFCDSCHQDYLDDPDSMK